MEFIITNLSHTDLKPAKHQRSAISQKSKTNTDGAMLDFLEKSCQYHEYPEQSDEGWIPKTDIICKLGQLEMKIIGSRVKCEFTFSTDQKGCLAHYKLH